MNLLITTDRSLMMIAIKQKTIFLCYFTLVLCLKPSFGQFIGQQSTQFNNAQLSPQQQGHILSDIQLHQHRFNLNPNNQFNPQQFTTSNFHNQPQQQQQQQNFNQIQFPNAIQNQPQQTALPAPILQQSSIILPTNQPILTTVETPKNRIVQHHTQTSFTPNFAQQQQQSFVQSIPNLSTITPILNPFQPRPTVDPILAIEQQIQQLDPEKHKQHIKELREKQAIIDKHNQFVERQYEKALKKAQADHQEFIEQQKEEKKKLYQRFYKPNDGQILRYTQSPPRYLYPEEAPLFKLAVEKYYQEHPTTTTTTTPKPTTTTTEKSHRIKIKSSFLPTALPSTTIDRRIKTIQTLDDLNQLRQQYKTQQIAKDDLLAQLRLAIGNNPIDDDSNTRNVSSREISLANGKRIQVITTKDPKLIPNNSETDEITLPNGQKVQVIKTTNPNLIASASTSTSTSSIKTQEITLPNGEKVEIIKTNDPKLVPGATPLEPGSDLEKLVLSRTTTTTTTTTTPKPPKIILDELTKSVIPPGANFELLKTDASGGLEQIGGIPQNLPNKKKVTFVLLEEQDDGTLKVQGVRGNDDNGQNNKPDVDVDSILRKIKEGEIKLPARVKTTTPTTTSRPITSTTIRTTTTTTATEDVDVVPNSFASEEDANLPILKTNIGTHFVATSTPSSTLYTKIFPNTVKATTPTPQLATTIKPKRVREPHILNYSNNNDLIRQASSASSANQNTIFNNYPSPTNQPTVPSTTVTIQRSISSTLPTSIPEFEQQLDEEDEDRKNLELTDVLRRNGLFAMAKFLKQSGLDTILNETGPYTIFVPNDKAFRTLLVQLGGPERAEEKFKENPRLLSGLLLHHVIPGAFTIGSLQDEMTGVSLAGTQLRVNQYNMHDLEWNDVKVTTINGAKILDDKKDIEIPQGIAHAIDRVMFPLPVGDIVQTLQSDRERRFTSLLRAIFASGLAETLQGTKTFTLFAPTDKAFMNLSTDDLNRMVTNKVLARELIFRHLIPTTLYTNGMRYYQIKESLLEDRQLTLSKQAGKIRVNNIQLSTQNIPATNGVIHAIDTLL